MATYLFYDIETTGLNPAFDQILQFAAIRTDMTLKETDRCLLDIRLRPDIVPSARAMLTHGIRVANAGASCCEYEAIQQIHRWVNDPGTISIGYNSLNFDDEFLRFAFYRNLLPPYTHQYAKGCLRMDLFPMVIAFWLYRPDALDWPEVDGKLSLKLEHLNAANGLADGRAHDALTDTRAALALARRLVGEQDMWNYLSGYFHKTTDLLRAEKLPVLFESPAGRHSQALMVGGEFGRNRLFQVPVIAIGPSVSYTNQTLWLRLDLPELSETTADSIPESTWVIRKKMGEPALLLPPLERYWRRLDTARRRVAAENLRWLRSEPDLFGQIVRYHRDYRYPTVPDLDADAALYDIGFLSPKEQERCRRFHGVSSIAEKAERVRHFEGPVLRELAKRILFRNFPSQLSRKLSKDLKKYMARVDPGTTGAAMVDFRGNRRNTPADTLAEIQELRQTAPLASGPMQLLDELAGFIARAFPGSSPPPAVSARRSEP